MKLFIFFTILSVTFGRKITSFRNVEDVFKFTSDLRTSMFVVQMSASYNYDVIVLKSDDGNRLNVKIENVQYRDKMDNPSEDDIKALQIPFIVELDGEGDWEKVIVSPKDNKFSLDHKDTLLTLMTFNQSQITEALKEVDADVRDLDSSVEDTPLGQCSIDSKIIPNDSGFEIEFGTRRNQCKGQSEFMMMGSEASPDSVFTMKMAFENQPIRFKKAQLFMDIVIETSPKIKVKTHYSYQFMEHRPVTSVLDLSEVTVTYTVQEFEKKLAELKSHDEDE